jgi:hypothetical protein
MMGRDWEDWEDGHDGEGIWNEFPWGHGLKQRRSLLCNCLLIFQLGCSMRIGAWKWEGLGMTG